MYLKNLNLNKSKYPVYSRVEFCKDALKQVTNEANKTGYKYSLVLALAQFLKMLLLPTTRLFIVEIAQLAKTSSKFSIFLHT